MIEVAKAINSFAQSSAEQTVPTEEPVFILTSGQLQDLISRAVQPLQVELEALKEEISLERAYDRQRIAKLERKEPQPLQRDRGEILRALLVANNGKMLAKEARQKMHLSKPLFSMLIASMADHIETKPFHLDKRQDVIILKTKLVQLNL
jgi:hypothetical protein